MNIFFKAGFALMLALAPLAASAQEMSKIQLDLSEARIKELVYEAIRENPEIVMEAVAILQKREDDAQAAQTQSVLSNQRQMLERDPNAPVLGNPEGDVTIVEFFDYNCPYCKRAMPEVQAVLESDANVRLVYREWPILGEASVYATRAALASRVQGKYEEMHWALMGMKGRVGEERVMKVAKDLGLDLDRLRADMQSPEVEEHIATSMQLAQALGFNGTPSFVIGQSLIPGFVEQDQLLQFVDESRKSQ
jgi:protein-disulfide isomerase